MPANSALTDDDRTALRQNGRTIAAVANAGRFAAAAVLYEDDAALLLPNTPAVAGRRAIEEWMASNPPLSNVTIEAVEIDGAGDVAYVRGNYALTLTPPGAAPIHDRGKFVEIWRRQADGGWKMRWDIFNSDLPAAT